MSLMFATVEQLREKLAAKEISRAELVDFYHRRFAQYESNIDAALALFDQKSVLADAPSEGRFGGIPGLVKDNISIAGRQLTCGSRILEGFISPYDATAIARLRDAGFLFLGKANLDEFAMGSSTETSAFKKTKNPWDLSRVPGGSSGGSAAAVAAGLVPWALGSETGGSVRQPAAFCGVVGFKPTYGLISRYGLVAYGSSLDQIGIFAHTAYDVALLLSEMAGVDPKDSSTLAQPKKQYAANLSNYLPAGLKIGVVASALAAPGMDADVVHAIETAVQEFTAMGAAVSNVSLSMLEYGAACYFIVSRAEAASNLARFDGVRYGLRAAAPNLEKMYFNTRHDGFGTEVKVRILVGNYVLSEGHAAEYYEKAQLVQSLIRHDFDQVFKKVDVLVMPTHPAPAFPLGAYDHDKLQVDLQDYFTCPMNLAGIPAISVPCGMSKNGLPIGFQIAGPHLSEELILQVAHAYQQRTAWHLNHPSHFEK